LTAPSQIETERLTLRRRCPDDAGALVAMRSDSAVTAWLARSPMSVTDARATIARFKAHSDARYLGDHLASRQGHALRTHVVVVACAMTIRPAADLSA
jgi:RimJ/RimL family protein N-acetyltransferase